MESEGSILVMTQGMDLGFKGLAQNFKNVVQAHIHLWSWSTPSTSLIIKVYSSQWFTNENVMVQGNLQLT